MIYTKNKEKSQLFASCFGVYLYLIIFSIAFSYNSQKIIIKKIFWTIIFSLALIFIIYPLLINQSSQTQFTNINIFNFVNCLIFALPEEIIFRWFLQEKFEKLIPNKFIATTLVGLLFGIIHFFGTNYSISSTYIIGLIFTLGSMTVHHFLLNLVKEKSDSIIVPTIVHALYNLYLLKILYSR